MMPIEPCYSDLREGICRAFDPPRNLTFDNTSYLAAEVRLACLGVGRPAAFFRQSPNGLTILSFGDATRFNGWFEGQPISRTVSS